jgi:hypothetical protein
VLARRGSKSSGLHLAPEHLRNAVARLDAALPTKVSAQGSAQEGVIEGALLSK